MFEERDNIPERIILHHSASKDDKNCLNLLDIYKWHVVDNGWSYIGYHWVIERVNGVARAIPGRPEWAHGAHCPDQGMNFKSIAICCVGDYSKEDLPADMLNCLYDLIREIYKRYNREFPISGHFEYTKTSCPGDRFPLVDIKAKAKAIWQTWLTTQKTIEYKYAIDQWSKRKLSDGTPVIQMQGQWNVNLLSENVSSANVRWLLSKTCRYILENGI
jgi:N-acetylmuramoyl-L-alanine amidase